MVSKEIKLPVTLTFLYSYVFINLLRISFLVLSIFDSKVLRGVRGRRGLVNRLREKFKEIDSSKKRIWFHASSLGEFEQAKPVIELLKERDYVIIVSFFSPSGYEYSLNYRYADLITYIPLDSPKQAEEFADIVKADVLVVMRYDLWLNHIMAAKKRGTRVILADATFPTKVLRQSHFLKRFYRFLYLLPDLIITTSADQKKIFDHFLGEERTIVAGDTRFDRVFNRSLEAAKDFNFPFFRISKNNRIIVFGSTWREDIEIVAPVMKRLIKRYSDLLMVIVPHEPTTREIDGLRDVFPNATIYSKLSEDELDGEERIMIVDVVGILSKIYSIGLIAYVGGGFGSGVHSVLEPAVYGVPIVTGPHIERSNEAVELQQRGALFHVNSTSSAYKVFLRLLTDKSYLDNAGRIAKEFVHSHLGASRIVAEQIVKKIFSD